MACIGRLERHALVSVSLVVGDINFPIQGIRTLFYLGSKGSPVKRRERTMANREAKVREGVGAKYALQHISNTLTLPVVPKSMTSLL
jgi:hypothetical protein